MKRLAEILRWPWWTVTTARHRAHDDLSADRLTWTPDELAALPHIAPERPIDDDQVIEDADQGETPTKPPLQLTLPEWVVERWQRHPWSTK